jgi:TM2 domain-containing membrane protein YozV
MFTPRPHQFEKTALLITRGIGSPLSVVIHTILFIICFMIGFAGVVPFDEMLLVLLDLINVLLNLINTLIRHVHTHLDK